jgi:hypothetical protein
MNHDPLYSKIVERLSKGVDGATFERCAQDLLNQAYPALAPVVGGDDAGMDGAIGTSDGPHTSSSITKLIGIPPISGGTAADRARVRHGAEAPGGGQPADNRRDRPPRAERDHRPERERRVHPPRRHLAVARGQAAQQADLPLAGPALFQGPRRRRADVRARQRDDPRRIHVVHANAARGISDRGKRLLRAQREAPAARRVHHVRRGHPGLGT